MEVPAPLPQIPPFEMNIQIETASLTRALVVEDSPTNQTVLTLILRGFGFDVTIACNGEEGVEKFTEQSFDVVLMDVQMPVMDGLTATRHIRDHETISGKHTLIIAVTAGMDRESCLGAGMDDHLHKPVRPDDLLPLLEPLMARPRLQR